jgi:hypothetical protein
MSLIEPLMVPFMKGACSSVVEQLISLMPYLCSFQ